MPKVLPFRAVRPTRDKVGLIAARPYECYTEAQRKSRLDNNPYSFLHIMNPGYRYHKEIFGSRGFQLVKNRYEEFKEENNFIQDENPAYYFHKIVHRDGHVFHGIVGAASVDDYTNNTIKKHEFTFKKRVQTLKESFTITGFNAEPVLLTHADNPVLQKIYKQISSVRAEYEFTTTYRDTHYLWVLDDPSILQQIQDEFEKMDMMYIADGHHRSQAAFLLAKQERQEHPEASKDEPFNYFMAYHIPESDLKIYNFNRLIKDLNGLSKEELLIQLDTYFRIENRGNESYTPKEKGQFCMYLDGNFYSLQLRKNNYEATDALSKLDIQILYETVLKPILGIKDLSTDERLTYTEGLSGMAYVKGLVDKGDYKIGFEVLPSTIAEVKKIADAGLRMPPKATYIEPKLRSGITIYEY